MSNSNTRFPGSLTETGQRTRLVSAAHNKVGLSLFSILSLSLFPSVTGALIPSNKTLLPAGQIASSTCFNTAAATKNGEETWLDVLEKHNLNAQKARWKNTGSPVASVKTEGGRQIQSGRDDNSHRKSDSHRIYTSCVKIHLVSLPLHRTLTRCWPTFILSFKNPFLESSSLRRET